MGYFNFFFELLGVLSETMSETKSETFDVLEYEAGKCPPNKVKKSKKGLIQRLSGTKKVDESKTAQKQDNAAKKRQEKVDGIKKKGQEKNEKIKACQQKRKTDDDNFKETSEKNLTTKQEKAAEKEKANAEATKKKNRK